ncbi:MAG TPA: NAD-dependent epimerase/dehydratase family protein, partial [Bacteroidia bacterium]|nr:NAD-dependent epimerase/dehydratase family protein [Bacteroidia bacterium]
MILVTGGTGLIGSHLLYQLLHTEERIRVLKRKGSKAEDVKNIFS